MSRNECSLSTETPAESLLGVNKLLTASAKSVDTRLAVYVRRAWRSRHGQLLKSESSRWSRSRLITGCTACPMLTTPAGQRVARDVTAEAAQQYRRAVQRQAELILDGDDPGLRLLGEEAKGG